MKKILAVDDDESILEVIQIVLESEGYLVQVCRNGACLKQRVQQAPDLILLDVLLSGEDGRELCKQLKRNPQTRHIPVIMLSAHSDASSVASTSGADDFLEKPFDVDDLIALVERHLTSTPISRAPQNE